MKQVEWSFRSNNEKSERTGVPTRVARLRQDPAVHRRPPTPQLKKTFKRERREALGDEKGDNGRETSAIRPGAYARQNHSPERSLLAIPVKNTGLSRITNHSNLHSDVSVTFVCVSAVCTIVQNLVRNKESMSRIRISNLSSRTFLCLRKPAFFKLHVAYRT
jgi:hypothetical protein